MPLLRTFQILGPDSHGFHGVPVDTSLLQFLSEFTVAALELQVPLYAVTHHESVPFAPGVGRVNGSRCSGAGESERQRQTSYPARAWQPDTLRSTT
jgi:hypothetical protein